MGTPKFVNLCYIAIARTLVAMGEARIAKLVCQMTRRWGPTAASSKGRWWVL